MQSVIVTPSTTSPAAACTKLWSTGTVHYLLYQRVHCVSTVEHWAEESHILSWRRAKKRWKVSEYGHMGPKLLQMIMLFVDTFIVSKTTLCALTDLFLSNQASVRFKPLVHLGKAKYCRAIPFTSHMVKHWLVCLLACGIYNSALWHPIINHQSNHKYDKWPRGDSPLWQSSQCSLTQKIRQIYNEMLAKIHPVQSEHMARWKVNSTANWARRAGLAVSLDITDGWFYTWGPADTRIGIQVVFMKFNLRSDSCSSCGYNQCRDYLSALMECLWFIDYEVSLRDERGKHPLCSRRRGGLT